ncbi:DUF4959 domain-containing protein [Niastella caeni]|uniref:DUF4959 domain-containing protein n=1 Tax=Niastella caeni TaxID=2569763 RepID=A0A4S8H937_9BACT|nr:DUF4959 domain-containing protein [Niastella caeni]THU31095.1 DUF4959 domain-containing protein [Niastella caeni]
MKSTIYKFLLLALVIPAVIPSCKKRDVIGPLEHNGTPPGAVSNGKVENLKGEARITYTLPDDEDLLYVKAIYEIRPGVTREVRASFYTNNMLVDGFKDSVATEVTLYAVNRSETVSAPYKITVHPLRPAYLSAFDSLKVMATFGGINIRTVNPDKKPLAIIVLLKDQFGRWTQTEAVYSQLKEINQSKRGMDTLKKSFAFYVRDQFQNQSDTLFADLSPLYETLIPKSGFSEYLLPGDLAVNAYGRQMRHLWDGLYNGWGTAICTYETITDTTNGAWFTFDMGTTAQLSRFTWWHYPDPRYFENASMKVYELWGTTNPNPNGSWVGWTKLVECRESKPSGLPYGQENSDDKAAGEAGSGWEIPISAPPVRYIRVRHKYNYSGFRQTLTGCEISIWGKPL